VVNEAGETITINQGIARQTKVIRIPFDHPDIPFKPLEGTVPIDVLRSGTRSLVNELKKKFAQRPIWSRRAMRFELRAHKYVGELKYVYQYVGYEFSSGPWQNCIIKFGIDPRKDPNYRFYQAMNFHFETESRHHPPASSVPRRGGVRTTTRRRTPHGKDSVKTYVFDGANVDLSGKTWQVNDITDPLIKVILDTDNIRQECHVRLH
jgi:general transcription factor 3C polypeptide 5 (transcription factor C subunit 1)